jgi:membrane fusion protein, multidrug efflux system
MARLIGWSTRFGLLAVILCSGGCSDEGGGERPRGGDSAQTAPVEVVTVQAQDLQEVIDSIGSLEPLQEVEIQPEISGIVQTIHFQEGQPVRERDLLFTLDDAQLRQRLRARQAALEGAEVEMANARRIYQRRQELFEENVIALETRDEAKTEFEAIRARVERLNAEILELKEQLLDTRIRSPIEGRAGERRVDIGDFVDVGDLLVTVVRINRLKVTFTVPERFMPRIENGQTIEFHTASRPGKTYRGEVYFISPQIQEDTRQLLIKGLVDNAGGELRPGAFVTVKLIVGQRPGALVLPEEALIPTRTGYGVFVIRDSNAFWRSLEIGLRKPGLVEIRRGLEAGEVVIRSGHISVSDGDKVRIVEQKRG